MDTEQFEGGWERDGGTRNSDRSVGYSAVSCMCAKENGLRFFLDLGPVHCVETRMRVIGVPIRD